MDKIVAIDIETVSASECGRIFTLPADVSVPRSMGVRHNLWLILRLSSCAVQTSHYGSCFSLGKSLAQAQNESVAFWWKDIPGT